MNKTYPEGRIRRLAEQLAKAGLPDSTVAEVMAGGGDIASAAQREAKAAWFQGAIGRLDKLVDEATCRRVRQGCACCLGGKRLEISRGIARDHATFAERLAAANEAKFVFGHSVTQLDDGQIEVSFFPAGLEHHGCPCLPHLAEPQSPTYCECCAGHVRHHLSRALGVPVEGRVVVSALSSGGREGCRFWFRAAGADGTA